MNALASKIGFSHRDWKREDWYEDWGGGGVVEKPQVKGTKDWRQHDEWLPHENQLN